MTEKIESMEVHPMRGHSRGEWYCSSDDIAPREQDAEYWAVFGVTHRGNEHCLGEFPTKIEAKSAIQGLKKKAPPPPTPSLQGKKIIQIEVVANENDSTIVELFALCDDGSIWRRGIGTRQASGLMDDRWEQIPLDGIDGLFAEASDGWFLYSGH
jgi:hypothetical protein